MSSDSNPRITWESETDYQRSGSEIADFVLRTSKSVADEFDYSKDELYLANFKDNHIIQLDYEKEGETGSVLIQENWDEASSLESYEELLEDIGVENVEDIRVFESVPGAADSGPPTASHWEYDRKQKQEFFWLTTEDNLMDFEPAAETGFSGVFTARPYTIDSETVEKEYENLMNTMRKTLGFEPETYHETNVLKQGLRCQFIFQEDSGGSIGPKIGNLGVEEVENVYNQVRNSDNYSLDL